MQGNSLQRFDRDGIELIIDTTTGESFATIKGYARMAGLTYQAIQNRIKKGGNFLDVKSAEVPTSKGVRMGNLIGGKTALTWLVKDGKPRALSPSDVRRVIHKSSESPVLDLNPNCSIVMTFGGSATQTHDYQKQRP